MQILGLLATRPKTVAEIARELRLHRMTLRYHLAFLLSQGLVEVVKPSGPRKAGRPAVLYRAARHPRAPGVPPRRFEILSQLSLEALVEAVGKNAASKHLRAKGLRFGRSMIEDLASRKEVERWTPDTYEHYVLDGLLKEFGIASEVMTKSTSRLMYRSFTCPVLELAEKMPDLVCDALDDGFLKGMEEALGGVSATRLKCMGHGDPYCEYFLRWTSPARPRSSRKRKGRRGS